MMMDVNRQLFLDDDGIESLSGLRRTMHQVLSFDKSTIKNNQVKDQSAQNNDGIINGGAKVVAGKFADALEFDGVSDFVEIPLTASITFTK